MALEQVEVSTLDGVADAILVRPNAAESLPGVIMLTDIFGLRDAYNEFSTQIANRGFVVLTPNIFYRSGRPPIFSFPPNFQEERTLNRMKEIRSPLTPDAMARDGVSYVDFLSSRGGVKEGGMAVVGFCFSGKFALHVAAERADRIAAVASFHGGGLYTDDPDSPHLVLPRVKADLYFGHAENDGSMPAEAIEKLEKSLQQWGGQWQSEIYPARHGWMIPGREIHDPVQAAIGFEKMIQLFDNALKQPARASR